uniref:dynein heavy chain 5, axonemal-like n=1 Tax=Maylandia zebra TaxID=106582 RepID=UPI000D30F190|nr:dynein heavy chain 5, axonemal-like isoform X2 [Maylandia zebra]XP_024656390.1 dynein heavy chain 5, axonemal-like isoform X3 [Maylandia zebra]XP_024656395.1 dynein heavy chain 5, axonemal-like [Maylandia zebra]
MLLSNEARREVAKQARAVKEERRAALDARHKYLMSRLADAGSLEEAAVEDAIVSDDRFSLIHEFFAANGSKKLIFFYQDVKQRRRQTPSWQFISIKLYYPSHLVSLPYYPEPVYTPACLCLHSLPLLDVQTHPSNYHLMLHSCILPDTSLSPVFLISPSA